MRWRTGRQGRRGREQRDQTNPSFCTGVRPGGELRKDALVETGVEWVEGTRGQDLGRDDDGVFELREMSQICGQEQRRERERGAWAVASEPGSLLSRAYGEGCFAQSTRMPWVTAVQPVSAVVSVRMRIAGRLTDRQTGWPRQCVATRGGSKRDHGDVTENAGLTIKD